VKLIDFSPCEKYIMTFNAAENDPECFMFWDIRTGVTLKSFSGVDLKVGEWPIFKWSFDGKYLARKFSNAIHIFETPSFELVKVHEVEGVADFEWSPSDDVLAYWAPEIQNNPATVTVIAVPSLKLVRDKRYFQVVDIRLYWQKTGDYLAVRVARMKQKVKPPKFTSTLFEVFRMKEKDIPVEGVELNEVVGAFSWDPRTPRFAIITGENSRNEVHIYNVRKAVKPDIILKDKQCNQLYWAPNGDFLVIAAIGGSFVGSLEFFSANEKSTLSTKEHPSCNHVVWDPSGRFVVSCVTQPLTESPDSWKYAMNNGYKVWSLSGKLLHEVSLDRMYQFLWRPRPVSPLSKDEIQNIRKSLREKYYKQFDTEDEQARESQMVGEEKRLLEIKAAWKAFRASKDAEYKSHAAERKSIRGFDSLVDNDWETMELIVEEEISYEEEVL
jgi:translation initiation factor 3 subunit B